MSNYQCPKCSGPVQRKDNAAAGATGGLVGVMLSVAFAGFQCVKCGPIARSEFPDEVRSKMMMKSMALGVGALVLLVVVIGVVVAIN
jgi:predicted nucleic-acid-binding Zn-ribbon protein